MNSLQVFCKQFTSAPIHDVQQIDEKFFKIDSSLKKIVEKTQKKSGLNPSYAGVYLGKKKKNEFFPSLALLDILSAKTRKKVVIDNKAEWLFLCKHNIFGKSVLKAGTSKGLVIVQNKKEESLGYGKITNSLERRNYVVIKNILDRGDFLRRERRL